MSASHHRRVVPTVIPPAPAIDIPARSAMPRARSLAGLPARLAAWLLARIDPFEPAALDAARRQPPAQPGLRQTEPWRGAAPPAARDRWTD